MERKEIYRKQQVFEQELATYNGDDPLKLRYDFIAWLDESYGKENVMDTFFPVLEDTLKSFWNVAKYQQDSRFLQLIITYISMQSNPTDIYKTVYEKGIGSENPLFYISWANAYVESDDYKKADEIFNLGLAKTKSKSELKNSYEQFLVILGKKFLRLINSESMQSLCPKCSSIGQKDGITPLLTPRNGDLQCWELNPLKVGEPDEFKCPVVVHDPPDPSKKSMYPKHLVYVGGKEYSLEEIKARLYDEKEKEKAESEKIRKTDLQREDLVKVKPKDEVALKNQLMMEVDNVKNEFGRESVDQENAGLQIQEEIKNQTSTQPQNNDVYNSEACNKKSLAPMLLHDSLTVTQTSYTAHMKEAMNVVQEMWSSPTPSVSTTVTARGRSLCKSSAESMKETPFSNENPTASSLSKKSVPFSIYTEAEEEPENCVPTPGCAIRPDRPKAMTSIKKDSLQVKEQKSKGNNVLSERKPKSIFESQEFDKRTSAVPCVKQQLPFSNAVPNDDNNELLAVKLGDVSLVSGGTHQQMRSADQQIPIIQNRITTIKPLLPTDQDDLSDVTCNTKAFNFSLPSSTPIQNRKFPVNRNSVEPQGTQEEQVQGNTTKNPAGLSIILEASKERYSSSSSSNGCAIRGQSTAPLNSVLDEFNFFWPSMEKCLLPVKVPWVAEFPKIKSVRNKGLCYENILADNIELNEKKDNKGSLLQDNPLGSHVSFNKSNENDTRDNKNNSEILMINLPEQKKNSLKGQSIQDITLGRLECSSNKLCNEENSNNNKKISVVAEKTYDRRRSECVDEEIETTCASLDVSHGKAIELTDLTSSNKHLNNEITYKLKDTTHSSRKKILTDSYHSCKQNLSTSNIEKSQRHSDIVRTQKIVTRTLRSRTSLLDTKLHSDNILPLNGLSNRKDKLEQVKVDVCEKRVPKNLSSKLAKNQVYVQDSGNKIISKEIVTSVLRQNKQKLSNDVSSQKSVDSSKPANKKSSIQPLEMGKNPMPINVNMPCKKKNLSRKKKENKISLANELNKENKISLVNELTIFHEVSCNKRRSERLLEKTLRKKGNNHTAG